MLVTPGSERVKRAMSLPLLIQHKTVPNVWLLNKLFCYLVVKRKCHGSTKPLT